ncbi:lysozyme family protein [Peribacillus simplex]|nr:lysozyme family protein [Peribacillus simplex]MCM3674909.1 lysozyme family protein [Peribacillus simplex]
MAIIQQESGGRELDVMQSSGATRFSISAFARNESVA